MAAHFVAMAGLRGGYLPNYCDVAPTLDDAVENLCFVHDFGRVLRKRLKDDKVLYLDEIADSMPGNVTWQERWGNELIEIYECHCDEPWVHQDDKTKAQFIDELGDLYNLAKRRYQHETEN